jgi:hypothetical protein
MAGFLASAKRQSRLGTQTLAVIINIIKGSSCKHAGSLLFAWYVRLGLKEN